MREMLGLTDQYVEKNLLACPLSLLKWMAVWVCYVI